MAGEKIMIDLIENNWKSILETEMEKEYFLSLEDFLLEEIREKNIFPPKKHIFQALNYTDYDQVKAVIIGQDPYHGQGQANGLSFSVNYGIKTPPSLRNIYIELKDDLGLEIPNHGNLESWAKQGVLLLNTSLTVVEKSPNSHRNKGWEIFTDKIIEKLNQRQKPIVFILWGKNAEEKEELISNKNHFIVKSFHPSPFSARRGFFKSKPFSKTNEFLKSVGQEPIDWHIDNID